MGSYDVTCCLSGLPIQVGDPVYFLFLGSCGPPFWDYSPVNVPFLATYNDYGLVRVEPDTPLLAPLVNMLSKGLDEDRFKKALSYHSDPDKTKLDDLLRAAYRDGLVVSEEILRPAMICIEAWEYLSSWTDRKLVVPCSAGVDMIRFLNQFPGRSGELVFDLLESGRLSEVELMGDFLNVHCKLQCLDINWKPSAYAGQEHNWDEITNWHAFLTDVAASRSQNDQTDTISR